MELIDNIKFVIEKSNLESPVIELYFDKQRNIWGYISSPSFKELTDNDAQTMIWKTLRENIPNEELAKVFTIFTETPEERSKRFIGEASDVSKNYNFWYLNSPDLSKYWIFIDVGKFDDGFKSFYLVINEKEKFQSGLVYQYPFEVIRFMEIPQENTYTELYQTAFNAADANLRGHLMYKYEEYSKKGFFVKNNIFEFVYSSKSLPIYPCPKNKLIFTNNEIQRISELLSKLPKFHIFADIYKSFNISERLNGLKTEIK